MQYSNHRYLSTPDLSYTRPPPVRCSCTAIASLGRILSRLHRAYDGISLERNTAIRSIRAGVSGRYIDTAVKIIIGVVIGGVILAGLYTLFNTTVVPNMQTEIGNMFTYSGT